MTDVQLVTQDCQAQVVMPAKRPAGESFHKMPVAKLHGLPSL